MYGRLPTFCYNCGKIRHGFKTYTQTTGTGQDRVSPPPCVPWGLAVSLSHVPDLDGWVMEMELQSFVSSPPAALLETPIVPSNTDFRPCMLVSHRRNCARGSGTGSHASHAISSVAANVRDGSNGSRPSPVWGPCGGSSWRGQGGHLDSCTKRPKAPFRDLTSINNPSDIPYCLQWMGQKT